MSVAIMGHNDFGEQYNSEEFEYLPVSAEHSFITLWEPAIAQLNITTLANGIYLKKADLPDILEDFRKIRRYMLENYSPENEEVKAAVSRIDWLITELPARWQKCPTAETLWMG